MSPSPAPARHLALGLILAAAGIGCGHAAEPLPDSLRPGYVGPVIGPASDTAYARGNLGLVRSSFGRASLFVAWRVMQLPPGALARESHDRKFSWVDRQPSGAPAEDEIKTWLGARGQLVATAPAVAPDYFRASKVDLGQGQSFEAITGHCGPGAFVLATRTLQDLRADATLNDAQRKAWVAAQDAVFARCSASPGTKPGAKPAPALPPAPPAQAPARLKALHAYQRAAALFYGDDFAAARSEFDAIAALPDQPMRAWAVLGAMRSIVRETVLDKEWAAAVDDAWTRRGLRGNEFRAAVADAAARRKTRVEAALKELEARGKLALADASLAPVHAAIGYTARRAYVQLNPALPFDDAMKVLATPTSNPYTAGALDLFQELYPRLATDRPEGAVAARLRQHEWFDFVVTVQACSDTPGAPGPQACAEEHAHALARWQATRHNSWLLAALMTAQQPGASDLATAEAALAVKPERPEWASLQVHAARVLRALGRGADARAALEAVAASNTVHKRDKPLLDAERRKL